MRIWIDAQLSPRIATWIVDTLGFQAVAVRDLGLRDSDDIEIFNSARDEDAIVLTKDRDFLDLLGRFGPPPKLVWLTCGNTSRGLEAYPRQDPFRRDRSTEFRRVNCRNQYRASLGPVTKSK